MSTSSLPVNKVAQSSLITIDLDKYYPTSSIIEFDISIFLFKGIVLKEQEFREQVQGHDWSILKNKMVTFNCSTQAIVPKWAYMLLALSAKDIAEQVFFGNKESALVQFMLDKINSIDLETYKNKKVIIKGCGKNNIPTEAYVAISNRLLPVVDSLMYGEACSTVPIFKTKK